MSSNTFKNVTKQNPCAICGRTDFCSESSRFWLCRRSLDSGISRTDKNGVPYSLYPKELESSKLEPLPVGRLNEIYKECRNAVA